MATVPSGQKFHTVPENVNTEEKGSKLANSQREIYTMQDIIDTIPAGAAVNPTPTFLPVNVGGVFVNSSLRIYPDNTFGTGIPLGFYSNINPVFGGGYNLNIDDSNGLYSFGVANASPFGGSTASGGIAISPNSGEAIINCGMASPYNGVFKANGASGKVTIGTSDTSSIGVNTYSNEVVFGSQFINTTPPYNTTTPAKWLNINDANGHSYKMPIYQ